MNILTANNIFVHATDSQPVQHSDCIEVNGRRYYGCVVREGTPPLGHRAGKTTFDGTTWGILPDTQEEITAQMAAIKANLTGAVQTHLDAGAQALGYDNIVSACSYAAAANSFQADGLSFLTWRAAVWTKCYQVMAEVEAATRPIPTESELIALLPARV